MFKSFLRRLSVSTAIGLGLFSEAQAVTFDVKGDNYGRPYAVQVTLQPVAIVTSNVQSNGFNYDVDYTYSITYVGDIPSNIWNLQMGFNCGGNTFGNFSLPTTASTTTLTGSGRTVNNQYTSIVPASSASLSSLGCLSGNTTLIISGPGLSATLSKPTNAAPLPVTLISFDARKTDGGVYLTWNTANEEAGDRYFVERSTDATHWASVSMVPSTGKTTYDYTDMGLQAGTTYYRLRNIDAKGEVTYSRILGVKTSTEESQIALFPNPSNGQTLRVSGMQTPSDWTYSISNGAMQPVGNGLLSGAEMTLPEMPTGLYFVRFTNQKTAETKVLKMVRN